MYSRSISIQYLIPVFYDSVYQTKHSICLCICLLALLSYLQITWYQHLSHICMNWALWLWFDPNLNSLYPYCCRFEFLSWPFVVWLWCANCQAILQSYCYYYFHLNQYNWVAFTIALDTCTPAERFNSNYNDFVKTIHWLLYNYAPQFTVTLRSKDPKFIMPFIKHLLRKRTKLLHQDQLEHAEGINIKIKLVESRECILKNADSHDSKSLWQLLY